MNGDYLSMTYMIHKYSIDRFDVKTLINMLIRLYEWKINSFKAILYHYTVHLFEMATKVNGIKFVYLLNLCFYGQMVFERTDEIPEQLQLIKKRLFDKLFSLNVWFKRQTNEK